jgi:hypothetical protein
MRPGGFEPPTNGLEGRRSSTELRALVESVTGKRGYSSPGLMAESRSEVQSLSGGGSALEILERGAGALDDVERDLDVLGGEVT